MKVLFLDESGDHNLAVIDPQYPIFVLVGIIVDQRYAEGELTQRLNAFKREMFGAEDIVLHTSDIARNRYGFEKLIEEDFRRRFYEGLNALMRELDFRVVACVIRKEDHLARYGVAALDPYMLSLDILVERFCFDVGNVAGGGLIVAEKRDPVLNHQLELAWLNLKIQGTRYLRATDIEKRIVGLTTRRKSANLAGLQLADLVANPIGRAVLGKPTKEDYRIIEGKFRRSRAGQHLGFGLVVLPKNQGPAPATQ
ncbi:MAG: DUF3800 domain-containing protein [Proteobacteria bacterium]|nr:DUF3800 domain-containing protein [Pseudomonadota bacterium]